MNDGAATLPPPGDTAADPRLRILYHALAGGCVMVLPDGERGTKPCYDTFDPDCICLGHAVRLLRRLDAMDPRHRERRRPA